MGYALVGSPGPVNLTVSSAPNTPSFGQPTSAGHLLVGWLFSNSSSSTSPFSVSGSGWVLATTGGGSFDWTAIYCRPGCGAGESAPTFTTGGTFGYAMLAEFSGGATVSPVDQTGAVIGSTPITATTGGADAAAGNLIVLCVGWNGGNPGPTTITTSIKDSTGSSVSTGQSDNHTDTGAAFYDFAWGFGGVTLGGSADTGTATLGLFSGGGAAIASFKPGGSPPPVTSSLLVSCFP